MPTVPRYEARVAPQALPGARVQADFSGASGEGLAKGLGQAADVAGEFAYREKQKADVAAAMEADQFAAQVEFDLFHNPQTGVFAQRGKGAIPAGDKAIQEFDRKVGEYAGKLQNDEQRQAFAKLTQGRRQDLQRSTARFGLEQMRQYQGDLAKSYVGTASQAAVANYTDRKRIDAEAEKASNAMLLDSDGKSPEQIKIERDEAAGQVYAAAIGRMMEDSAIKANELFTEVRDRLPADVSLRLASALENGVAQETGTDLAEKIVAKAGTKSAALSMLNEIEDPKVKAAAKSEVNAHFAELATAKSEATESAKDAIWRLAVSGVPLSKMPKGVVNAAYQFSPETIKEVMKWEEREGGPDKATVAAAYGKLSMMSREDLAKVNPNDLIPLLGTGTEFKTWTDRITAARKPEDSDFTRTQLKDQFDTTSRLYPRFLPDTKGKLKVDQETALGRVWQQIDRDVEAAKRSGKALTHDDRQAIIDRAFLDDFRANEKIERDEGLFSVGKDIPVGQITIDDLDNDAARIPYKRIPLDDVEGARGQLATIGAKDTEANIALYYSALLAYGAPDNPDANKKALAYVKRRAKGD